MPVAMESKGACDMALEQLVAETFPAAVSKLVGLAAECGPADVTGACMPVDCEVDDDDKRPDPEDAAFAVDGFACQAPPPCHADVAVEPQAASAPPLRLATCKQHSKDCVVVFDWDDTLLSSSHLAAAGFRLDNELTPEMEAQLRQLERSVQLVLQTALRVAGVGRVFIITNAELGWVELSCQKWLPGVAQLLQYVPVVSARTSYERFFPERPVKWKAHAFMERLAEGFRGATGHKHVISFGDSHVERQAVLAVTRGQEDTTTKSIKFTERPSLEQLRRQLELVANCFHYIHDHDENLDLVLHINEAGVPSPQQLTA